MELQFMSSVKYQAYRSE